MSADNVDGHYTLVEACYCTTTAYSILLQQSYFPLLTWTKMKGKRQGPFSKKINHH